MSNPDGDGQKPKVKKCPILNEWCTEEVKERCTFSAEMMQVVNGVPYRSNVCFKDAVVIMLSEINAKTQPPQQKIQLPGLLRG